MEVWENSSLSNSCVFACVFEAPGSWGTWQRPPIPTLQQHICSSRLHLDTSRRGNILTLIKNKRLGLLLVSSEVSLLNSTYYFGIHLGSHFFFVKKGQKYNNWINDFTPLFLTILVKEKSSILILNTQQWQRDYNCYPLALINHPRGQGVFDSCDSDLDAETVECPLVHYIQHAVVGSCFHTWHYRA